MPSSMAARVALRASSMRCFFPSVQSRWGADLYDRDSTGELGETLLELLAVPVRIGVLDLTLDLGDASRDVGVCTAAVD